MAPKETESLRDGRALKVATRPDWTALYEQELAALGEVEGVTAAQLRAALRDTQAEAAALRERPVPLQHSELFEECESLRERLATEQKRLVVEEELAVNLAERLAQAEQQIADLMHPETGEYGRLQERLATAERERDAEAAASRSLNAQMERLRAQVETLTKERDEAIASRNDILNERNAFQQGRDTLLQAEILRVEELRLLREMNDRQRQRIEELTRRESLRAMTQESPRETYFEPEKKP